ncbi:MAG: PAS domain S-box protein [Maribacter sp.]|nr:PAS domain S-box protein [Maribacter sp.]
MAVELIEKDLFQTIFNSAGEGILVVDNNGLLLKVNPAAERMFGYDHRELNNCKLENLVPNKFREKHNTHRKKYVKNPESRIMGRNETIWGLKKDGSQFPIEISLSPAMVNELSVTIAFITDATEQKIAEQELRAKEAKNMALLEAMPDMMVIQNYAGDIIEFFVPDQIAPQVPKEQVIGKNIKELVPSQMGKTILNAHNEAIKTNQIQIHKYSINNENGNVDYEARTVCLNNHSLLTIIRDITEKNRIEKEFRDIEAKNRAILAAMPDLIIVHDKKGNVIQVNTSKPSSLVAPIEDLLGKNVKEFLPAKASVKILRALSEVHRTKKMALEQITFPVNGIKTDYETRFVPFGGENILTIARDITKEKNAQLELEASEAKNRAIINALPDTIIIYNKEGDMLDVLVSDPSSFIFPREMLIGKNVKDVFPSELSKRMIDVLSKAYETKSLQIMTATIHGRDRTIDLEGRVMPIKDDKLIVVLRDITESKAIQDVLNVRNRALEAAGNGIIIADARQADNPIIYCNDAFTKITGYNRSEVLGRNCRFLQKDDRDQKPIGIIRKAIKKGHPCHEVLRNYRKDGTLFWNELTITPVRDDQGILTHFIEVQSDITQRKREEFLKDQIRVILEMIAQHQPLEIIGDTIVETAEGHISDCIASILLYNMENSTLHTLSAPNLPDSIVHSLEGLKISPDVRSFGSAVYPKKKEVSATDLAKNPLLKNHKNLAKKHNLKSSWSFPILSSDQDILGTFVIYSEHLKKPKYLQREIIDDITYLARVAIEQHNTRITLKENREQLAAYAIELEEQVENRTAELSATVKQLVESNLSLEDQVKETKIAENKAKASELLFATIARNFPKGAIAVVNSQYRIIYLDGGELSNFGIEGSRFKNIEIDQVDLLTAREKQAIKESVNRTLKGEHLSFEIEYNSNDYTVNTIPLGDEDERQALFVYNNITIQKEVESEILKALYREQELNELKSRFISMASHEFRTPLSAILSSAILIGKQNEPGKELKREKYIDQIKTNVKNLVVILNDFLSLSKLEEGKVRAKKEDFDLILIAESLVENINPSLKKGQEITIKSALTSIPVFLDPKLTSHILTNLLSNAIKYSDEHKKIDLVLKRKKRSVVLKVVDQGMGIPAAEQANLFQRFFRADNSTNVQGTGLGLHIVKQYTDLMGGTVDFKSILNKGTTFTVELPTK